jgi:uncharacterized small protein (DUF1192 family)
MDEKNSKTCLICGEKVHISHSVLDCAIRRIAYLEREIERIKKLQKDFNKKN